jgi:hypothetical protein
VLWVEYIINNYDLDSSIIEFTLSESAWSKYPHLVELILSKNPRAVRDVIVHLLDKPYWKSYFVTIMSDLLNDQFLRYLILNAFKKAPHWNDHPEYVERLIDTVAPVHRIEDLIMLEPWSIHPHLVRQLLKYPIYHTEIAKKIFTKPYWLDQTDLVFDFIANSSEGGRSQFVQSVLKDQYRPDIVKELVKYGTTDVFDVLAMNILSSPEWFRHPEILEAILRKNVSNTYDFTNNVFSTSVVRYVLYQEYWSKYPDLLMIAIENSENTWFQQNENTNWYIENELLKYEYWNQQPELLKYLDGKPVTLQNLQERQREKKFTDWRASQKTSLTCLSYLN